MSYKPRKQTSTNLELPGIILMLPCTIEYEEQFLEEVEDELKPTTKSVQTSSLCDPFSRINPGILILCPVLFIYIQFTILLIDFSNFKLFA